MSEKLNIGFFSFLENDKRAKLPLSGAREFQRQNTCEYNTHPAIRQRLDTEQVFMV